MRLASYNVFEGARRTYPLLIEFVKRHDIDILCLQEADGWHESQDGQPSRLDEFAALTGLEHYAFGDSNTVCKLVTFSRHPITEAEVYTDGFAHCAVKTTIGSHQGPVKVVNFHLTPFSARERYYEARRLTRIMGEDAIAAGDANNPSPEDNPDNILHRNQKAQGNFRNGIKQLCFGALNHILRSGYVDAARHTGNNCNTYPTPIQTDPFHRHVMRLDYIFVPPQLAETIKDFEVIKNELTDQISDHYPGVVTLAPPTAAQSMAPLPSLQPSFGYAAA